MGGLFLAFVINGESHGHCFKVLFSVDKSHIHSYVFLCPRPGMFIGLPLASLWYWCIDQEMAQRVLSSKGLEDAQLGAATAGFMKIMPVFITGELEMTTTK